MVRSSDGGGRKVGKRLLVDDGDDEDGFSSPAKLLITDPAQPRGGSNRMVEFLIGERSDVSG